MGKMWNPSEKRWWGSVLLIWGVLWLRTFSPGRGAILIIFGIMLWLSAIKEQASGK